MSLLTYYDIILYLTQNHSNKMWKCNYDGCKHSSNNKNSMKEHQESQHEGVIHRCKVCQKGFTRRNNIPSHMKSMHGTDKFDCDKCDYTTNNKINLRKHRLVHHAEKTLSCDECDFKAGYVTVLRQHTRIKHEGEVRKIKRIKIQCPECLVLIRKDNLSVHLFSKHNIGIKHVKSKQTTQPTTILKCSLCEYTTKGPYNVVPKNLKLHKQRIHDLKTIGCNQCQYKAGNKSQITRHQRIFHGENGSRTLKKKDLSDGHCVYKPRNKSNLRTVHEEKNLNQNRNSEKYLEENEKHNIRDENKESSPACDDEPSKDGEEDQLKTFLCPVTSCVFTFKTTKIDIGQANDHLLSIHIGYRGKTKFMKL